MNAQSVTTHLRTLGHRISRAREAIIEIFSSTTKPLTAIDVLLTLEKVGLPVNKTTVYRELEFLLAQHLLQEVQIESGIIHYESAAQDHHHHLICQTCKQIVAVDPKEIEQGIDKLARRVRINEGFTISDHSLEFYGHCAHCQ
ncbi:transcriptional repressor [Candidatus Roizmanbacteria bacterium]|nr:transcriptional repressor [Candidatus Roizmanbacteria bacterium]